MKNLDFQFVLCPGKDPQKEYQNIYENIYACWYDVWNEAFSQIHPNHRQTSENFTRQDYIGAILVDGQCKAMSVYKHANAKSSTFKKDAYFQCWSDKHLEKLCSRGSNILVCSHFTIHPSARKDAVGLSMRDLLMGLTTEVCLHSRADAMTGAMRKSRQVHSLAVEWGAELIASDVPSGHNDELSDLVVFFKDDVERRRQNDLLPMIKKMWADKIVIEQRKIENMEDFKPTYQPLRRVA
jgi:hypothetical protein